MTHIFDDSSLFFYLSYIRQSDEDRLTKKRKGCYGSSYIYIWYPDNIHGNDISTAQIFLDSQLYMFVFNSINSDSQRVECLVYKKYLIRYDRAERQF